MGIKKYCGLYPFLNYVNVCKIFYRIGSAITVKISWVGGSSADVLRFTVVL